MWNEKVINSKGIRYKFCERFLNPNTNKMIKLSVTLNSNTTHETAIQLMPKEKLQNYYKLNLMM